MAPLVLHMILGLRGLTSNGRNFYRLRIILRALPVAMRDRNVGH